jgi:hypothetical protein
MKSYLMQYLDERNFLNRFYERPLLDLSNRTDCSELDKLLVADLDLDPALVEGHEDHEIIAFRQYTLRHARLELLKLIANTNVSSS